MFFFKRSILRNMSTYYRKKFKSFREQNDLKLVLKDVKDLDEISGILHKFAAHEFGIQFKRAD